MSGALRRFAGWVASGSVGYPLLEGIDYWEDLRESPSQMETSSRSLPIRCASTSMACRSTRSTPSVGPRAGFTSTAPDLHLVGSRPWSHGKSSSTRSTRASGSQRVSAPAASPVLWQCPGPSALSLVMMNCLATHLNDSAMAHHRGGRLNLPDHRTRCSGVRAESFVCVASARPGGWSILRFDRQKGCDLTDWSAADRRVRGWTTAQDHRPRVG